MQPTVTKEELIHTGTALYELGLDGARHQGADVEQLQSIYARAVQVLMQRAPITAQRLENLFGVQSIYLGDYIYTISEAYAHLQSEFVTFDEHPVGHPANNAVENADNRSVKEFVNRRDHEAATEAKGQKVSEYNAKMEAWANRREAIATAKKKTAEARKLKQSAMLKAREDAKQSVINFSQQWDTYIETLKQNELDVAKLPLENFML